MAKPASLELLYSTAIEHLEKLERDSRLHPPKLSWDPAKDIQNSLIIDKQLQNRRYREELTERLNQAFQGLKGKSTDLSQQFSLHPYQNSDGGVSIDIRPTPAEDQELQAFLRVIAQIAIQIINETH